eukprot:jgi/Ulvmu1/7890/UM004_0122.1
MGQRQIVYTRGICYWTDCSTSDHACGATTHMCHRLHAARNCHVARMERYTAVRRPQSLKSEYLEIGVVSKRSVLYLDVVDYTMNELDTQDLCERARSAIVEAHRLSNTLQNVTSQRQSADSDVALCSGPAPAATDTASREQSSSVPGHNGSDIHAADAQCQSAHSTLTKLVTVAQRLADLRDEHETTLWHLMHLRLQQLTLRRQQLSALHGLLLQQLSRLGAPEEAPLQRTRSAVASALALLVECSADLEQLVKGSASCQTAHLVETVDAADKRADDVSSLARRLLEILQDQMSMDSACRGVTGLSLDRLDGMPQQQCTDAMMERVGLSECPICLHSFKVGDQLSCLPCCHVHHHACLIEWLRISASCPICKLPYPTGVWELPSIIQHSGDAADSSHRGCCPAD